MKTQTNTTNAMLAVRSPNDGNIIGYAELADWPEAEALLLAAQARFADRNQWLAPHERISILEKLAFLVEAEKDALALQIATEGGKPLRDARIEVARAIDGIRIAVRELPFVLTGEEVPMELTPATMGRTAHCTREPIGVVFAISAFNHPLNLIIHQVIPAIATGCPVIVKPASATPFSCLRLIALLHQAGLPEGWAEALVCDNTVAERLATDPRIAFLNFIGSADTGWKLRSKLAPGVRCTLEHGGNAPVIVDDTSDYDSTIEALLKGGFYHAGQVCVSVQRVYAERPISLLIAARLAEGARELIVGDARSEDTDVGPLISPREAERIDEWVQEAIKSGADCLCGGERIGQHYYAPTVLFNPPEDAKVTTEEIFGPVVCVYEYDTLEDAIRRANASRYAFQAAIFSTDQDAIAEATYALDASTVMVNDHTAFRADWMPFGGRRASGLGVGGIGHTMQELTQIKLVVTKEE